MRITKGILVILLAAFLGVALASRSDRDWGEFWRAKNLCGPIGALIAGSLDALFGHIFSWFWPLLLVFLGVMILRGVELREQLKKVLYATALVAAAAAFYSLLGGSGSGGIVGDKVLSLARLLAGRIGSVLVLIAAIVILSFALFRERFEEMLEHFSRLRIPGFSISASRSGRRTRAKRSLARDASEIPIIVESETKARSAGSARETVELKPLEEFSAPRITVHGTPRSNEISSAEIASEEPVVIASESEDIPLPDLSLLEDHAEKGVFYSEEDLIARSGIIEQKLRDYGLDGKVQEVRPGPVVTTFEYVPAPGVKVSQIASRADDISLALAARSIRIQAPIPGRGAVGIEVPNPKPSIVSLKELLQQWPDTAEGLVVALGKTVTGEPYFADLADMPHLLIAGATGSGKSVCINTIICSLLFHHTPSTCRFILVDPKRLELIAYNDIPHLLHPVITESKTVLKVLQWLTTEMDRRYKLLASVGVKNIQGFNRKVREEEVISPENGQRLSPLAFYVAIIDELADIMVTMGNEIYPPITRLSQMARAVGIHLVFATQRPSVDVVTGLIKANFPARIAFQVSSKTDSRTILDANGAEKLLGNGDMLYLPKNLPSPIRIQGAYISEAETERVAAYWRKHAKAESLLDLAEEVSIGPSSDDDAPIDDELFQKARELVILHQQGSISLVQRRLRVGYARAARLIDMLEQAGVVGPFEGSKARRVLVSREEYDERL